ncbi:ankyrin [Glonium stellatum]|uniref:Ankyrin n=1 Tax=Glonium stellatum TaxID=574774 RepID=A0A8E2JU16_9PEZI|nr:ankyrin [Glonium stellatum]
MPHLTEEEIDDILYLSRVNECSELSDYLTSLSAKYNCGKRVLFEAAVDPESGNSALHYAAANGHIDILNLISTSLSSVPSTESAQNNLPLLSLPNAAGNTALHWASLNGHLACVQLLVKLGADVTAINKAGHDAIFEAEINEKEEVVKWLLGEGEGLEQGVSNDVIDTDVNVEGMRKKMEGMAAGGMGQD